MVPNTCIFYNVTGIYLRADFHGSKIIENQAICNNDNKEKK